MRLKQLLITLTLLIGSVAVTQAQTDYGFWINGTPITSANVNNLHSIQGIFTGANGQISFDPKTYTLSMKNVRINSISGDYSLNIGKSAKDFTLHLEGENYLSPATEQALHTKKNLTIEGPGKLTINTQKFGISVYASTLTLSNECSVHILSQAKESGYAGVDGIWNTDSHLVIQNASLEVQTLGSEDTPFPYAIGGFQSIQLDGVKIVTPTEAQIGTYNFSYGGKDYSRTFVMEGNKPATEVKIEKSEPIDYGISFCGVPITSYNRDKLGSIDGVTIEEGGYIVFHPDTQTLSMKNVIAITETEKVCEVRTNHPMTLHVEGRNQLYTRNGRETLSLDANTRITGSGLLVVDSKQYAIRVGHCTLTIEKGCTVDVGSRPLEGSYAAITGATFDSHLVLKEGYLYARAEGKKNAPFPYAIGGFQSISLKGAEIRSPSEAEIREFIYTFAGKERREKFIMLKGDFVSNVRIEKTTAVEKVEAMALKLYPNPAERYVRIEGAKADTPIALYTLEGVRLLTAEANEAGFAEFDLTDLPAGNYVVKAGNGQGYRLLIRR